MSAAAPLARTADDDFFDVMRASHNNPLFFCRHVLHKEPRRWQRELFEEIRVRKMAGEKHTTIHVRAAHGSGKGWAAGVLAIWWQATRPGARTLTLAPTWRDVEQLLWSEIRSLYGGSLLNEHGIGRMLTTEWKTGESGDQPDPSWFATGASADNPENLEGQHSTIAACRIVDEAKAVDDGTIVATEGLLISEETLDVFISTPSTRVGMFYELDVNSGPELLRKVVTIEDLVADNVPGAAQAKQRWLIKYGGEGSFEYQSRAMAEYVDNAEGVLIPFRWIERAMYSDEERVAKGLKAWHVFGAPVLGYDVAGSVDGDENAVSPTIGPDNENRFEVDRTSHWHEQDTQVSKDKVIALAKATRAKGVRADVQGLGKGVCDAIRREAFDLKLKFTVEEYRAADPAEDPERFLNRKAENAWNLRLAMEKDLVRLPKEPTLRSQMAAMKYEVRQGKIRIVDPVKDSPDHFDAVLIGVGSAYTPISMQDVSFGQADAPYEYKESSGWGDPT